MKRQADKKRSERQFSVGDMVFVKLQPYVQSTLAPRSNQKLSFKFYGPFQITERIGSVAYKLLLPSSAAIHPVFHVSQLKAAVLPHVQVSPSLPADIELYGSVAASGDSYYYWLGGARPDPMVWLAV